MTSDGEGDGTIAGERRPVMVASAVADTGFDAGSDHARRSAPGTAPRDATIGADYHQLGPCRVAVTRTVHRRVERTADGVQAAGHDLVTAQLTLAGAARGMAGDRPFFAGQGTVLMLDLAQPFLVEDLGEREVVAFTHPKTLLGELAAGVAALHGAVFDRAASTLMAAAVRALMPRLAGLAPGEADIAGRLAADLLRLTVSASGASAVAEPLRRQERLLQRAHAAIEARLGSADLTPERLADELHVSRSDLYSAFQDEGGVAKAIWRRRLEAARTALSDPLELRRIGELAFFFGFTSEAHFARAFRAHFGMTASDVRRTSSERSKR